MRRSLMSFVLVVFLAGIAAVSAQDGRSTTNQGATPNGRPFTTLQAQIDALEADLQTQIDALEAELQAVEQRLLANEQDIQALYDGFQTLQTAIFLLQQQDTVDAARISSLEAQLAGVTQSLANGCLVGSSIRQVSTTGQVFCELDDVSAGVGHLATSDFQTAQAVGVPSQRRSSAFVFCPTGTGVATGGGFNAVTDLVTGLAVVFSAPVVASSGATGWQVQAFNPTQGTLVGLRAITRCARVVP